MAGIEREQYAQTVWTPTDSWRFSFWLFGMTIYAKWNDPRMVIVAQANAIGLSSR